MFREHDLKSKPFINPGSSEAIKQAVMAGLGVSVLSIHNIRLELENQLIKILNVQGFPLRRHWFAAYPATKSLYLVARSFIEFLVDESEKILLMIYWLAIISSYGSNKSGL